MGRSYRPDRPTEKGFRPPVSNPGRAGGSVTRVPRPAGSPAVEVESLTIRYGDLTAVEQLSFCAHRGRVTALLGPNGAGKTSTVETLEGYRPSFEGRVRVLGLDPVRKHGALTRRIGVMPQEGGVYTGIRPSEALRLFADYFPDPLDPGVMLDRVGLAGRAGTAWRHLSGGERQRLSLALALVGRPEVVFLDEPTAGIDVAGRQVIRRIVDELREDGVAVLLATHDLAEAEKVADEVLIIDRGRLLAAGSPRELRERSGPGELRFTVPMGLDRAALGDHLGAPVEEMGPGEYRIASTGSPELVARLTGWLAERGLSLTELRSGAARLEDVFLGLTGSSGDALEDAEEAG